jgi:aspartate racemase
MKTIGLLGGMSWESTADYYREINEGIKQALGGLHSGKILLYSVNFDPLEKLIHHNDWDAAARILTEAARKVQAGGAEFLLICTNTMHKVAPQVENGVSIPLLHIADATAEALVQDGVKKVALLGTAVTMEQEFYKGRLSDNFGLDVLIPDAPDRKMVNDVIFGELCLGIIRPSSKKELIRIVGHLKRSGAEAVILGCTELGMLIKKKDSETPLYDTARIHAAKAVEWALLDGGRRVGGASDQSKINRGGT